MGRYSVEAALKVAVASEATESVNSLGNLINQQNKAQIEQNKLIAKVLKEVTEARKTEKKEIVEVTRKERDATANKSAFTAAVINAKGAIYDYTIAFRNLGEAIGKGLTMLSPWIGWITMVGEKIKAAADYIDDADRKTQALTASLEALAKVKIPDLKDKFKISSVGGMLAPQLEQLREAFGDFWSLEQKRMYQNIKGEMEMLEQEEKAILDWDNVAKDQISYVESAQERNKKNLEEQNRIVRETSQSLLDAMHETQNFMNTVVSTNPLGSIATYLLGSFTNRHWESPEQQAKYNNALAKYNQLFAEKIALDEQEKKMRDSDSAETADRLFEVQRRRAELQAMIEGLAPKYTKDKGKSEREGSYINKDKYPDLEYFWENYYKADGPIRESWLDKLRQERDRDRRKADKIFLESPAAGAVARALVAETFYKNVERGQAEQMAKVIDLNENWQREIARSKALEKEQEKVMEAGSLKYRTYDRFSPDLTDISPEKKRELEEYSDKLAKTLNSDIEKAWDERSTALNKINKEIIELTDMDKVGMQPEDLEKILNRVRYLEEQKLAINKEYMDKRRQAEETYEQGTEELHKKEVKMWGDQWRIIDKNSEAWKKSDDAMNTMISALDMLGISNKKVFALQNYAKGIEASVDAINCQADALIQFGLGDIKGGLALQAAAIAKGVAAVAYFKNSTEMGGKGGTAPSIGTGQVVGSDNKERNITINMAFEGTAGAIIGPLADAFNQQASVPGGVRLNSNLIRR